MKRAVLASVAALLSLSAPAWAGSCGVHCIQPGPTCCLPNKCPCDGLRIPTLFGPEHTQKLLCDLCACDCCTRICAARKLGCCLHADYCKCPEVLTALAHAALCDTCWEVRRAAVIGIAR